MDDPRLTCEHRRLGFESNSLRIRCADCDQLWVTVSQEGDDRPDLTASNRGNAAFIDVAGQERAIKNANRISQRERQRADGVEAQLALAAPMVEAARWFADFVYPSFRTKAAEVPMEDQSAGAWARRLHARLAAFDKAGDGP